MLITDLQYRTYFKTYDEALEVADINQTNDESGWIYAVRFAGPRGHYIEVLDMDGSRLGDL